MKFSKNFELSAFFLLTFAWSWGFWGLGGYTRIAHLLAPFGPTLMAFLFTYLTSGKGGIRNLLGKGVSPRFSKVWLIPALFLMPTIIGLSLLLVVLSGEPLPETPLTGNPLTLIAAFFYILVLGGPLAEEFGWRGFALERLQAKYNALVASLILGIIWGLWHLPLFYSTNELYKNVPFPGFVAGTILFSILFTWIFNNTNGSVLTAILFHTSGNWGHFAFPITATQWGSLYSLIINFAVVLVVLAVWGTKRMKREPTPSATP
ncbi:type II CAAX endopeptidase family protein [Thermococcus sp. MAR1]|uniref:type II CAAX endopeptidase family protein n=1 Tax=Thermococcus sp. MAR1 TaxID=1638263 RepID=UPI0014395FBE|nr:type II CAAX endopeptidase family protein [Thermococcus sp. MAR1]NJE10036.1 CPBP family intramembrane metalloprotease [Thermococcus sp. MAR1]